MLPDNTGQAAICSSAMDQDLGRVQRSYVARVAKWLMKREDWRYNWTTVYYRVVC